MTKNNVVVMHRQRVKVFICKTKITSFILNEKLIVYFMDVLN